MKQFQPQLEVSNRVQFNQNLEGLRGLLALAVGFSHIFGITHILDSNYHPNAYWLNVGQGSVLMFFVLSGYVIGLTNPYKEYSHTKAVQYFMRRIVRLLPIYIFAIVLGFLVFPESWQVILGNLLFLQNLIVPRLEGNSPIWSLNYEIIYYLVFILIWWLRPHLRYVGLFCLMVSFAGWISPQVPPIIASYASGFIFWLFGLWLAWNNPPIHSSSKKFPLLSYVFLFYALHNFNFGKVLLAGFKLNNLSSMQVSLADLIAMLPICILLITLVTQRAFKGFKWIELTCYLLPLGMIVFIIFTGRLLEPRWIPGAILYALAIAFLYFTHTLDSLSKFAILGRISYGFYLVHFPLITLVKYYFPISGNIITFGIRILIWLCVSLMLSASLELIMQPPIKRWFYQKLSIAHI